MDIQENKHLIGEAIMFVYIGVSDLLFRAQSYSEKNIWGRLYSYLPEVDHEKKFLAASFPRNCCF